MKLTVIGLRSERDAVLVETLAEMVAAAVLRPFIAVGSAGNGRWVDEIGIGDEEPIDTIIARLGQIQLVRILVCSLDGSVNDKSMSGSLGALRDSLSSGGIPVTLGSVTSCLADETIDSSNFEVYWNYNFIVVPQESLGEERTFPVLITEQQRKLMVVVSAVALIGGLWCWLDSSPVDSMDHAGEGNIQRVRLARVVTRVVDAGDLTAKAVGRALGSGVQLPPPANCVPHGSPQQAVDLVLEGLVPAAGSSPLGFSYRPFEIPPKSAPRKLGVIAILKLFVTELIGELKPMGRSAVMRTVDSVKTRIESFVQEATFGSDSTVVVSLRKPSAADMFLDQSRRREAVERLPHLKSSPLVPSPVTWSSLVNVVLGLADGSTMPKGLEQLQPDWSGERAVIGQLDLLAARPVGDHGGRLVFSAEEWALLGGSAETVIYVHPYDVLALEYLASHREEPIVTEPQATAEASGTAQIVVESAGWVELAQAVSDRQGAESSDDVDRYGHVAPSVQLSPKEKIENWISVARHSLLWRVGSRLADEQRKALEDLEKTQGELERVTAALAAEQKAAVKRRRRFVLKSLLIVFFIAVLLTVSVVGFVILALTAALIVATVSVLLVVGGVWTLFRLTKQRVQWKHKMEDLAREPALVFARRQQAADEFRRLCSLYEQYLDWSEIVSVALHRPWGDVEQSEVEPWFTQTGVFSFSVGEPVVSTEELAAAALGVAQRVSTQGWLMRAYGERRQGWLDWYRTMAGGVAGLAADPEADAATAQGPVVSIPASHGLAGVELSRPRQQFSMQFCRGDFADRYRATQVGDLRGEVTNRDPARLIEQVVSDVVGLSGRSAEGFLRPPIENPFVPPFDHELFVTERLRATGAQDVTTWVGISPSVKASIPPERRTHAVIEMDDRFLLASFRLDVSDPMTLDDCPLVSEAPADDGHEVQPVPDNGGRRG